MYHIISKWETTVWVENRWPTDFRSLSFEVVDAELADGHDDRGKLTRGTFDSLFTDRLGKRSLEEAVVVVKEEEEENGLLQGGDASIFAFWDGSRSVSLQPLAQGVIWLDRRPALSDGRYPGFKVLLWRRRGQYS